MPLVKGQTVAYEQEASGAFIGSMETAVFQADYIRIKTMKIFVSIKDVGYRRHAPQGIHWTRLLTYGLDFGGKKVSNHDQITKEIAYVKGICSVARLEPSASVSSI